MANEIITKTCWKCGKDKPATLEYFHKRTISTDGLQRMCKPCRLENNKKKYVENPDYYVEYRKENGDILNQTTIRWVKKHRTANHPEKIYKVTAPDGNFYIGHTAHITAEYRLSIHKTKYRQGKNDAPLLFQSFKKFGLDAHTIEVVEELGYNKKEAEKRETYWINKLKSTLNKAKVKKC
jgi:hypothetical protein